MGPLRGVLFLAAGVTAGGGCSPDAGPALLSRDLGVRVGVDVGFFGRDAAPPSDAGPDDTGVERDAAAPLDTGIRSDAGDGSDASEPTDGGVDLDATAMD